MCAVPCCRGRQRHGAGAVACADGPVGTGVAAAAPARRAGRHAGARVLRRPRDGQHRSAGAHDHAVPARGLLLPSSCVRRPAPADFSRLPQQFLTIATSVQCAEGYIRSAVMDSGNTKLECMAVNCKQPLEPSDVQARRSYQYVSRSTNFTALMCSPHVATAIGPSRGLRALLGPGDGQPGQQRPQLPAVPEPRLWQWPDGTATCHTLHCTTSGLNSVRLRTCSWSLTIRALFVATAHKSGASAIELRGTRVDVGRHLISASLVAVDLLLVQAPWHHGMTCAAHDAHVVEERRRAQEASAAERRRIREAEETRLRTEQENARAEQFIQQNTRACPRCRVHIERNGEYPRSATYCLFTSRCSSTASTDGCRHMTCRTSNARAGCGQELYVQHDGRLLVHMCHILTVSTPPLFSTQLLALWIR